MTLPPLPALSRRQCAALRGLAIIGIVLHNYCHWLSVAVKENEYQFFQSNVDGMVSALGDGGSLLPVHLISFFGHYGVPIFLFLSGYGLTMKYERGGATCSIGSFVWTHWTKLFRMMIIGFGAFILVDRMTPGAWHYTGSKILGQIFMVGNLFDDPDKVIWPGPYWFFGLMVQLYIVYRLLLYKRHWAVTVGLIAVCFLAQCFCDPEGSTLNYIRYNFVGSVLPFGIGLLYARLVRPDNGEGTPIIYTRATWAAVLCVSLGVVFLFSLAYQSWYWVPVAVCAASVALVMVLPDRTLGPLTWMGGISSALFVSHPIARKIIIPVSRGGEVYPGIMLYCVAAVVLGIVFQRLISGNKPRVSSSR